MEMQIVHNALSEKDQMHKNDKYLDASKKQFTRANYDHQKVQNKQA